MNLNWDKRYEVEAFAYGKSPNVFFEESIKECKPGTILMPADGEGRNGVFAAQLGWAVTSCDLSIEGKSKALKLAEERGVSLEYLVGDFGVLGLEKGSFDAVGLIYAHFSADKKRDYHRIIASYLRPGGIVILEAFSKNHLPYREANPKIGGPMNLGELYSKEEIREDFSGFEILQLEEVEVALQEGNYHNGVGLVIRFVGKKN